MRLKILIFVIVIGLLCNTISATYVLGNGTHEIVASYGFNQPISGWVNMSFENEPQNSLFEMLGAQITLKDLLEINSIGYNCIPADCKNAYSFDEDDELLTDTISLGYLEEKSYAIVLSGEEIEISNFKAVINTDAQESCMYPLRIEFLDGDDMIEWTPKIISTNTCPMRNPQGCFDASEETQETQIDKTITYCQKITIPPTKGFRIGANIEGTGNAQFQLTIISDTIEDKCENLIDVTQGGEISCNINLEYAVEEEEEATICLEAKELNGNVYKIKYEDVETCGYFEGTSNTIDHDVNLFVYPLKYASITNVTFNQELLYPTNPNENDLALRIENYIDDKYDGICDPQCIIPIKFISGSRFDQELTLSNLELNYSKQLVTPPGITSFYELESAEVLLNMSFKKINLDKAKFMTPNSSKTFKAALMYKGKSILNQEIVVKSLPTIEYVFPDTAAALVESVFVVTVLDSKGNYTYTWDFGDNTPEITTSENIAKHTYTKMQNYDLIVKVKNKLGEATKKIIVKVESPKNAIPGVIAQFRTNLANVSKQINSLPLLVKSNLNKKLDSEERNIENLKSALDLLDKQYNNTLSGQSDEYFKIMQKLNELAIPYQIKEVKTGPIDFFNSNKQLDLELFELLGAGTTDYTEVNYTGAVNRWLLEEVDVQFESTAYETKYKDGSSETILSLVKLSITPKIAAYIDEIYIIINEELKNLVFSSEIGEKSVSTSTGIILLDLDKKQTIEFIYPGLIDVIEVPIYVSPHLKDIGTMDNSSTCDFDNKCDKSSGENWKNCPKDCKRLGMSTLMILILIFIAFIVYIILQEWYKRHYEKHLFPDRNQLFNLINFINNSEGQGISKSEIFSKLSEMDWTQEQLTYAWKKFKGKRTGMWEIPIFKWVEKKKVDKELKKRQIVSNVTKNLSNSKKGNNPKKSQFKQRNNNFRTSFK
ncbi:PKD domain-containing protein [Candidatus Pacearchaeota archaeon]|nr:PKD domain-containing protein [Candidatus Pacearchaeota archaeon]